MIPGSFSVRPSSTLRCASAIGLFLAGICRGEDSDELRYYLGLRGQDTNPLTEIHDGWGFSLGVNLNEYVGVELAVDSYEKFVDVGNYGGTRSVNTTRGPLCQRFVCAIRC
jgi:hypothetical protein